ncbi:MAG: Ig-like domain-containing protein [Prevotellaceae bacterium]|nr:Ig-like domain-containing protein [Prevotellaceae bacterium]
MDKKNLLLIALFALFFVSCKSKQNTDTDSSPSYNPYVEGFTSGDISVKSSIAILLSEPSDLDADDVVTENLFNISPSVKGQIQMLNNRTFTFVPDENLKINQRYTVKFNVGKAIKKADKEFRKFEFSFSTIKPSFYMSREGLQLYNETSPHMFQLVREVHISDYADPVAVEKMLTVKLNGKSPALKWEHEGDKHIFTIDSIKAGETASELNLSLNAKSIGGDLVDEETLRIPSKYEFDILYAISSDEDGNQVVMCRFSSPIDTKQSLKGIITLDDYKFTYRVSLNTILLYPSERLTGQVTLTIFESLKSANGGNFGKNHTQELMFESDSPEIKFLGKGNILPTTNNGTIIPFQAVSVKSVTAKIIKIYENNVLQFLQVNNLDGKTELKRAGRLVNVKTIRLDETKTLKELRRWSTYALDLSNLITPEQGAIYRVELSFSKKQAITNCNDEEEANTEQDIPDDEQLKKLESEYDVQQSYGYDYYYDSYDYEDYDGNSSNPCDNAYYKRNNRCRAAKNILASDLGIIAKAGTKNSVRFIVTNIQSISPVSAVELEIYNYQQQLIGRGVTNSEGLADVEITGKAFVAIAKQGAQRGYLQMQDGLAMSLSRFDVAGDAVKNGIKGFIYGERGVWRPGDSIFLSFILQDLDGSLPASHPVTLEITDARGQIVNKQSKIGGTNGFYTFVYQTNDDAPTGNWLATVKVGGVSFNKQLKIETVKPNRLKINLKFKHDEIELQTPIEGVLSSTWLHGAPAKNLHTEVSIYLNKMKTIFKGFESYVFDDPTKNFESEQKIFFSKDLNNEGEVDFSETVDVGSRPSGKLKANFVTRVFEEGGDFSIDNISKEISPYKRYVGISQPKGTGFNNMLETDKNQVFDIVVLNKYGKNVSEQLDVNITVYKLGWSWWWSSSNNQLANFNYSSYTTPFYEESVKVSGGRAVFSYKATHRQYGFYLIKVVDKSSGHSTGTVAYYDWPGWGGRARQGTEGATMLFFESDKKSYDVGENAEITFPSSNTSKALISIENGTKVLNTYWIDCKDGETKVGIKTTPEMTPNVYVSITLVQPHAQTQNDLPIRLFGVIPVNVVNPETKLTPVLDAPASIRPEESYKVTVSEEKGMPMTYTLAVVDEGLLDLTRFKTPSPWDYFYAKEALGVHTWDMYEALIGAYGGRIEQLFAIGGDDAASANRSKINRFKPVVSFIGPFSLDKGQKNTHNLKMHSYIGSVKIMVVAGNKTAYGNAEKAVPVKKPLMVLATMPRVIGPGEEIDLPVTIFSMDEKIAKVDVTVESNDLFTIENNKHTVDFKSVGEEIATFRLKVKEKVGAGKVKVTATAGNEHSKYEVEIEVRAPNPPITKVNSFVLDGGKSSSISEELHGMEGTNSGRIEASVIPPLNLGERLSYLIRYPHGCLEQTTSAAFPQLYLSTVIDLGEKDKTNASYNVKAALNKLKNFVGYEGGFHYWPGGGEYNDWSTSYAGDFMLEAEKKGFSLPTGLKQGWVKYQQKKARLWVKGTTKGSYYSYSQHDLDQSYRLYSLAKAKSPELGAMNRLKEDKTISLQARWVLAAAYALAGQIEIAETIIENAETNVKEYSSFSETYGSSTRDIAMIVDALLLMKREGAAFELVRNLSEKLNSNRWMSTQTTAYALMGISRYAENLKNDQIIDIEYTYNGKKISLTSKKSIWMTNLGELSSGKFEVKNKSNNNVYVQISKTGTPVAGQETAFENKIKLKVSFNDGNSLIDPSKLKQGTDFYAVIEVVNLSPAGEAYSNIALTQIFPSGWEIMNDRLLGLETEKQTDNYDYCDIRDDRIYTYFNLKNTKRFAVKLNAAYVGKFYLPAAKVEAMYDGTINANNTGQWVEVVK